MSDSMKTFVFALILSLVCSSLLAVVSAICQPRYKQNQILETKTKTLSVLGMDVDGSTPVEKINELYSNNVRETTVTNDAGEEITRAFLYVDKESGEFEGVAFPVVGKGLWGTIRGMAALNSDLKTIRGVRFFDHSETPGLGAEISQDWFQEQWEGKPAVNEEGKVTIHIVGPNQADEPDEIDGISGATLTGNGVNEMMQREIRVFLENFSADMAMQQ
ncbi:MAG: FMN-binding protein [Candidatus Sumerlaeia bacterium]